MHFVANMDLLAYLWWAPDQQWEGGFLRDQREEGPEAPHLRPDQQIRRGPGNQDDRYAVAKGPATLNYQQV